MKPYQAIGWTLLNTTSITAIVGSRINHGLRPVGTAVPSINYYELGGATRTYGTEGVVFSINCRSTTPGGARDLARLVMDTFAGSDGTGVYGFQNSSFNVYRASLQNDGGLIPEPEDNIYNAPVDIRVVYPVATVS
jgi:hypothetical protein